MPHLGLTAPSGAPLPVPDTPPRCDRPLPVHIKSWSYFSWSPTPQPTEAVESQSGRKQFLQLAMHKPYRCGSCYLLSTYSRSVSEVVGVCATGFSPGTNATELAAASPADTTYCARLLVRASVVLRVIEHRSAEEVAAEELEARARQPLRQGISNLPLGPRPP